MKSTFERTNHVNAPITEMNNGKEKIHKPEKLHVRYCKSLET